MDIEHVLKLLVGGLLNDAVPGVAGIIDDDVEAAQFRDGAIDQMPEEMPGQ